MNGASPVLPVHLLDIVAARRNPSLILSKPAFTFRARGIYRLALENHCNRSTVIRSSERETMNLAGAKRQVMISMMRRSELRLTAATAQGEMKTMDLPSGVGLSSPSQRESIHGSIFKGLAVASGCICST